MIDVRITLKQQWGLNELGNESVRSPVTSLPRLITLAISGSLGLRG